MRATGTTGIASVTASGSPHPDLGKDRPCKDRPYKDRPCAAPGSSHTNILARVLDTEGHWRGVLRAALALAHALETEADRALEVAGLSARGFLVLAEIHREAPRTQRALARRLGLQPSTTNELLGRLARRRLVRRRPTPTLTGAGVSALAAGAAIVARLEDAWAARLRAAGRGPAIPGWPGPVYGLRRRLRESHEALSRRASPAAPR